MRQEINWQQVREEIVKDDWKAVRTGYNSVYINSLKNSIPSDCRFWSKEAGEWLIHPDYIDLAETLAKRHFYRDPATGISWLDSWRILHLAKTAPDNLIECSASCLLANEQSESQRVKIIKAREILLTL